MKLRELISEGLATKQQYVAAEFIDEFGDGDHWYIKGTPDLVQKFVMLANSIEQASLQGTEYEPGQGTMGQIHSQLGNDQAPQWKIVAATNLDDIKPITNSVINVLSRVNLKDPGDEFMSDLLWRLEGKGLAQVSNDEGVAEDWSTKYKRSINCNNPKGFSQRAHCQGRKKHEDIDLNEVESADKKEAVRRIQKMLNKKFNANLDIDGILGPLTLRSINKFMPNARIGLADEPDKTTAVQGKKIKKKDIEEK